MGESPFAIFFFSRFKRKSREAKTLVGVGCRTSAAVYIGDSDLSILVKQTLDHTLTECFSDIHQGHPSLDYGKWRHDKTFVTVINDRNLQCCTSEGAHECTIPILFFP